MKTTLFSIVTLTFIMLIFVPNSVAEDSPQWHLPEGIIARLGKGKPTDVAYSPDGARLAVGTEIGIWIYDAGTNEELDLLTDDEIGTWDGVDSIAYSPDGKTLVCANGFEVELWDMVRGQLKAGLPDHACGVTSVAFNPDGSTFASSDLRGKVILWDAESGQRKAIFTGTDAAWNIAFSPDGRTLASSDDKTVRLWDTVNGEHKATLIGHTDSVLSVAFSLDGRTLASGASDDTIRLWDAHTGQHQATLIEDNDYPRDPYQSLTFSPDGKTLASGSWDGVQLWDVRSRQQKTTLRGHKNTILSLTFSPDGRTLAGASWEGTVELWDVQSRQHKTSLWHMGDVGGIAFNPDGETFATGASDTVRLWDTHTGQHQATFPWDYSRVGGTASINCVTFSPDGRTLAAGGYGQIQLWDVATREHRQTIFADFVFKSVNSLVFSPDGRTLASCGWDDQIIRLWDVATAQAKAILTDHTSYVYSVAFSPDGKTLASGSLDQTVRLWDVATAQAKAILTDHTSYVYSVAFSPDGKTLASGSSNETIRLWDARTGKHKARIAGVGYGGSDIIFTPDSSTLIFGDGYGKILMWDVAGGKLLETLKAHRDGVSNMVLSPDGRTLVSESDGGTVFVWEDFTSLISQTTQPDTEVQQPEDDTAIQKYEREVVRLIYFRPGDRPSRQGIDTELDTLIRWSQYFFAEQMQSYGRKTFAFETDTTGYAKVHHVTGKFTDTYYHSDTYHKVVTEVAELFDTSRDVFLIAVDVSSEFINNEDTCGIGGGGWESYDNELWRRDFGGTAVIPASGVCINPSITAHELGHVFGLEHDFRDDAYLMAYGTQERLSNCATEWLDAHRFFNNDPTTSNEAATMDLHASNTSTPGTLSLQFELTDPDGLHQAQLIVPTAASDPARGTKLHSCKSLNSKSQTVSFLTTNLTADADSEVTLQVIDDHGGITKQTFPLTIREPLSNRSPVAVGTIPDQHLTVGGNAITLSISAYFSDPDGDVLNYKAESNNTRVVGVRLAGTQITIAPRSTGTASVAVTASDGKLLVTQRIAVQVTDGQVNDATGTFDDTFNGTALQNPNWQWQNEPANWDVGETRDGFLHIESEPNRNLWTSDASHFLYQETDADTFDVETHFSAKWDTASGVNGLVVKSPTDNDWVTIKFWSRDAGAKGQIQYQTRGRGLVADPAWRPEFGATELFLRLRKQGDTYTGWYKTPRSESLDRDWECQFSVNTPHYNWASMQVSPRRQGTLTVDYAYFRSTVDTGVIASPVLHVAAIDGTKRDNTLAELPEPVQPGDMDSVSVGNVIGGDGAYLCNKWQFGAAFALGTSSCRHVSWQEPCGVLGRQKRNR